jgi:hypothetical protein
VAVTGIVSVTVTGNEAETVTGSRTVTGTVTVTDWHKVCHTIAFWLLW